MSKYMWKNITWAEAKADETICSLEHPLHPISLPKESFEDEFKPLLEKLNGEEIDMGPLETMMKRRVTKKRKEQLRKDILDQRPEWEEKKGIK